MDRRALLLGTASFLAITALLPASWLTLHGWRIGRVSQWITPRYSHCYRCQTTWGFVEGHSTYFSEPSGVRSAASGYFPLCEACWHELSPQERLPFYRRLFDSYPRDAYPESFWPIWERTVLNEPPEGYEPWIPVTNITTV